MRARRLAWVDAQPDLDPTKLVVIDETGATTKMARLRGRCARGRRLRAGVPHGHRKTTTFVAGLRLEGLTAPMWMGLSMSGASVEELLGLWADGRRDVKARRRPLFAQPSVAGSAAAFLDGLLGPERRTTGRRRAEAAGDAGPWRQQAVLGRSRWDAEALRDLVRDNAVETLAAPDAVLVIDETGLLKQGRASCGVHRQDTGAAGKITNRQVGVFAADVAGTGHAFIDRRLYLPRAWTDEPTRLAAARVPDGVAFATKPRLVVEMIERAIDAGVPCAWATADSVDGVAAVAMALRRAGKGDVLGVTGGHAVRSWAQEPSVSGSAEAIAAALPPSADIRLAAGDGTRGPRLYDWAYLELADLDAGAAGYPGSDGPWTRGLLIRRHRADRSLALFTTWCPKGTPIEGLARVEGRRWPIEDAFETAKTELGLDHNETRSWHGWHRHVALIMLAFALLAVIRHRADTVTSPQTSAAATGRRRQWCAGPSRSFGGLSAG